MPKFSQRQIQRMRNIDIARGRFRATQHSKSRIHPTSEKASQKESDNERRNEGIQQEAINKEIEETKKGLEDVTNNRSREIS